MFFIALDVYGAERAGGAQVFARAAAYAAGGVDNGYFGRVGILRVGRHHQYGSGRAVACAVAAFHAVGERHAVVGHPYGVSYLYSGFSSRVTGVMAPAGHTSEQRVHSGRQ